MLLYKQCIQPRTTRQVFKPNIQAHIPLCSVGPAWFTSNAIPISLGINQQFPYLRATCSFFRLFHFILLCFVFWDILFRVPVFSQRVIARIFLYIPYSFLHSYLYPYNSKRMLSKFTKNFPKSNFLLSQQHFVFFFLWLLWHRIVLFSFHSSLATASQSFGVGVPALHFCPCPTVCSVCSYLLDPVLQGHAGPGPQVWTQIMFKLLKCKIFKTKLNFPVAVSLGSHFC